jgi:hypothetical protein
MVVKRGEKMYQLYVASGVAGLNNILAEINEREQTIFQIITRGEQHIVIAQNPKKKVKE